jgi:hypothetical protein
MPQDEAARRWLVRDLMRDELGLGLAATTTTLGLWGLSLAGRAGVAWDAAARSPPLEAPVFLVGAPRTGTTFLQRLLVELGVGQGLSLGRMWLPSNPVQALVGRRLGALDALGPGRFHAPEAHATGMGSVETEDAALLFRFLDGFLAYAFFGALGETERRYDPADPVSTARDLDWLDLLWRGRALARPGRTVAKAASFGLRVRALAERYPDARFVLTLRDPCALIPSALSLVQGALQRRFPAFASQPALRARHTERLSAALVELLNRSAEEWQRDDFPRDRVHLCPYPRLVGALGPELDTMLDALGVPAGTIDTAARERAVQAQSRRRSAHRYSLEAFGLDAAVLRRACGPFLGCFGPQLSGAATA